MNNRLIWVALSGPFAVIVALSSGTAGWVGVYGGLVVGITIMYFVYSYHLRQPAQPKQDIDADDIEDFTWTEPKLPAPKRRRTKRRKQRLPKRALTAPPTVATIISQMDTQEIGSRSIDEARIEQDVVAGLEALGYKKREIERIMRYVPRTGTLDERLSAALRVAAV